MASIILPALFARSQHVQQVDPSLTALFVQEGYIQNFINVAMLTLVTYSACCVAVYSCVVHNHLPTLLAVTTLDKEV